MSGWALVVQMAGLSKHLCIRVSCCHTEATPVTTDMMLLHLEEGMSMKDGLAYFMEQHQRGGAATYRMCLSAKGKRPVPVIMKVR